jgi:hypothetical protein
MSISSKTNKAIFLFLIALVNAKAYGHTKLISQEQLENACVAPETIENLMKNRLILTSKTPGHYRVNKRKIDRVLANPENQEMAEFLNYLKALVGDDTEVTQKNPCFMTLGSQDIMM